MSARMIDIRLYDPETGTDCTVRLPADTKIASLTDLLYERKLKPYQPIGYGYIAKGHLCNNAFTLAEYLPEDEDSLALRIFAYPQVLQG